MPILSRNVPLGSPIRLSSWRKVAIGTWRTAGDPSVYGLLELDADAALAYLEQMRAAGIRATMTHYAGRAIALTIARHPQVNCILRFGRLYPRKTVDIFFQVATDMEGKDLSGMTIRAADTKSVAQITQEMQERVEAIRKKGDPMFKKMKGVFGLIPGFLAAPLLTLSGFFMYSLNLWSPLLGTPRDPFGSIMITNVGSLGLSGAFAPLVPYSRVPLLIAMGAVKETPVVRDGKIVVGRIIPLYVTFDHRLIDGVHAAHMSKTLKEIFEGGQV